MTALVVGAGPAGLMAAEQLLQAGFDVTVCDAMPSPGRKFLLAGIGGLNLTHSEATPDFLARYEDAADWLRPQLDVFGAEALRAWAAGLGVETFVGSSGRVFPAGMKAAPLLRRWLQRLRGQGMRLLTRHRWQGDLARDGSHWLLGFATPDGTTSLQARVVVLALGGGSWARLGSDGAWLPWLADRGVSVTSLRAANCGFEADWSEVLTRRAGEPLKNVSLSLPWLAGTRERRGECILTRDGLEGGLIYAHARAIRERIEACGHAVITLDLLPDRSLATLGAALDKAAAGKAGLTRSRLWQRAGLDGVKSALLEEVWRQPDTSSWLQAQGLAGMPVLRQQAALCKMLPVTLSATRPLDEAISTAGGISRAALDSGLMLNALPGVFCAGEMVDWEAPTGGYLLTACFASGRRAGEGAVQWLQHGGVA